MAHQQLVEVELGATGGVRAVLASGCVYTVDPGFSWFSVTRGADRDYHRVAHAAVQHRHVLATLVQTRNRWLAGEARSLMLQPSSVYPYGGLRPSADRRRPCIHASGLACFPLASRHSALTSAGWASADRSCILYLVPHRRAYHVSVVTMVHGRRCDLRHSGFLASCHPAWAPAVRAAAAARRSLPSACSADTAAGSSSVQETAGGASADAASVILVRVPCLLAAGVELGASPPPADATAPPLLRCVPDMVMRYHASQRTASAIVLRDDSVLMCDAAVRTIEHVLPDDKDSAGDPCVHLYVVSAPPPRQIANAAALVQFIRRARALHRSANLTGPGAALPSHTGGLALHDVEQVVPGVGVFRCRAGRVSVCFQDHAIATLDDASGATASVILPNGVRRTARLSNPLDLGPWLTPVAEFVHWLRQSPQQRADAHSAEMQSRLGLARASVQTEKMLLELPGASSLPSCSASL